MGSTVVKSEHFLMEEPHTEIFWHDDILRERSNIHDLAMYVVNVKQSAEYLFCLKLNLRVNSPIIFVTFFFVRRHGGCIF